MKALDLFCCAGGASAGLVEAGFDVTGIDVRPQPNYPWKFIEGNAACVTLDFIGSFDLVWASPPCLYATAYKRKVVKGKAWVKPAENLIPATRAILDRAGVPYVIENVQGARQDLIDPIQLCGSSFGLDVRRHRYFEVSGFELPEKPCDHGWQTPRFPPAGNRTNLRSTVEVGVWRIPMDVQHRAMGGLDWMTREELSKAIPPAYSRYIAQAFLDSSPAISGGR